MKKRIQRLVILCLAISVSAYAQIRFVEVKPDVIEARLAKAAKKNDQRRAALIGLFEEAGCKGSLSEQVVKGAKLPNVICILPGKTDALLIVGAHYDKVDEGLGVIDNWTGASLLPSLYESLKQEPREHTILFVGFTDEEKGLVGSEFYARNMKKEDIAKVRAMVNMDTLGLSDTKVWVSRADKRLTNALGAVAGAMSLPVAGLNVDAVGTSDSEPFRERKVPAITIHSLTQETLTVLHSPKDVLTAVKTDEYIRSYRLIAGYLAYLDQHLTPAPPADKNVASSEKN